MIIKKEFELLKGVPNILKIPSAELKKKTINNGIKKLNVVLTLMKDRTSHYSKEYVYGIISDLEKRKIIAVVNMPEYNLHISYNKPTKQLVFNVAPYNVDDIYATNPDPKNLYTQLVYGLVFYNLITEKFSLKDTYFNVISTYLLSLFIKLFGKEYGLLGTYSSSISKLNFLLNCYILTSFFGITEDTCYKKAASSSGFSYKDIVEDLKKFDFSKIEDFVKSLSYFEVFPGMNKYSFLSRILRNIGVSFLPALEDPARFIAIMTCVGIKGSNIVPTYISQYNEGAFEQITQISKLVLK